MRGSGAARIIFWGRAVQVVGSPHLSTEFVVRGRVPRLRAPDPECTRLQRLCNVGGLRSLTLARAASFSGPPRPRVNHGHFGRTGRIPDLTVY